MHVLASSAPVIGLRQAQDPQALGITCAEIVTSTKRTDRLSFNRRKIRGETILALRLNLSHSSFSKSLYVNGS